MFSIASIPYWPESTSSRGTPQHTQSAFSASREFVCVPMCRFRSALRWLTWTYGQWGHCQGSKLGSVGWETGSAPGSGVGTAALRRAHTTTCGIGVGETGGSSEEEVKEGTEGKMDTYEEEEQEEAEEERDNNVYGLKRW